MNLVIVIQLEYLKDFNSVRWHCNFNGMHNLMDSVIHNHDYESKWLSLTSLELL